MAGGEFILIGAGAHGRVTLDILESSGHDVLGFLDDGDSLPGKIINGKKIIGKLSDAKEAVTEGASLIIALGNNRLRKAVSERLALDISSYGNAVHASSVIFKSATLGQGNMIFANTVIGSNASIGNHVIINNGAVIEHDALIGDFVTVSPGCSTGGRVVIGEGAFISVGVTLSPRVRIGENSVIGAGAVVVSDIPPNVLAYGVPARVIRDISSEEIWGRVL